MNLFRILSWVLVFGATILAGPNLPAQGWAALREVVLPLGRRICSGLGLSFRRVALPR